MEQRATNNYNDFRRPFTGYTQYGREEQNAYYISAMRPERVEERNKKSGKYVPRGEVTRADYVQIISETRINGNFVHMGKNVSNKAYGWIARSNPRED